jgi:hypothetical protein
MRDVDRTSDDRLRHEILGTNSHGEPDAELDRIAVICHQGSPVPWWDDKARRTLRAQREPRPRHVRRRIRERAMPWQATLDDTGEMRSFPTEEARDSAIDLYRALSKAEGLVPSEVTVRYRPYQGGGA